MLLNRFHGRIAYNTENLYRRASSIANGSIESNSEKEKETYSYKENLLNYNNQMTILRRKFIANFKKKKEKEILEKAKKKEEILKAKNVRLTIRKEIQAIRAKELAEEKEEQNQRRKINFEEKAQVRRVIQEDRKIRVKTILNHLKDEYDEKWIVAKNLEEKMSPDFFLHKPQNYGLYDFSDKNNITPGSALSWIEKLRMMRPAGHTDISGTKS